MNKDSVYDKYEIVVGLEVHAQMATKSKMYCSDSTVFGVAPNTNIGIISLGHPGTLPRPNKEVFGYGIRLGLALGCDITKENQFARKNYFYADLPKGYQITQDKTPICKGGGLTIKDAHGKDKFIHLTRIHMEEDAGKSIHDQDPFNSLIDLNRAGVPLLEIVSEPEIHSPEEAYNYLAEIRKLVRYLEICDGNMEEGSMRCDANVSVRLKGEKKLGERAEVKNMNSLRNVQRAIEFEAKRQIDLIEKGEKIEQETRSFDAVKGTTFTLRSKEMAHDYRYFPEPDIQPYTIKESEIEAVKKNMPPLPQQMFKHYTKELGLSEYDATIITETKPLALYFNELIGYSKNYKACANWLNGAVKSELNNKAIGIEEFKLKAKTIAEIISLIDEGAISNSIAEQKLFPLLLQNPEASPKELAEKNNLIQNSNADDLLKFIDEAIARYPDKVAEYKSGKTGLLGLFMGEVMKLSKGQADPKIASKLVKERLEN